MVQQTDTKFSEYVLANTETGISKNDKKTALRDLQNENRNMVPKSDGTALLKENRTSVEAVKVSGIKRPHPESTMRTTPQQQTTTASSSMPLVYVRRKTESDQHKNLNCNKANDEPRKLHEHDGKTNQQHPVKESTVCIDKALTEPKTSEGVSSTTPLATLDTGKSNITSPVADSSRLQLDNAKGLSLQHWGERFERLQNILKTLDLSKQDDYCQSMCFHLEFYVCVFLPVYSNTLCCLTPFVSASDLVLSWA